MSDSKAIALTASRERPASTSSGYLMLLLLLVAIIVQVWGIVGLARDNDAMAHIIERHYCELPTYPGSGRFLLSIPELLTCIRDAYDIRPEPLHDTGNARRVVQLEKAVGFNRQFEATDKLTVITDSGGRILTAFPGDDL